MPLVMNSARPAASRSARRSSAGLVRDITVSLSPVPLRSGSLSRAVPSDFLSPGAVAVRAVGRGDRTQVPPLGDPQSIQLTGGQSPCETRRHGHDAAVGAMGT